jgi:asparagine synthase (glutamine-hydrolysing)
MCGIFGFYSFSQTKVDRFKFKESLLSLIHRGPDFQNCEFYYNDKIAFGHTRLSIIDLTNSANQPMHISKYHIIFNGEIYNYIELRKELIDNGYTFITNSDTEVIINSYDFWGEKCVTKFNGMWAFAILNQNDNSLFCSRDRFGVKPFNYYFDKNKFIFGSEIKPLLLYDDTLRKPNYNSISLFCRESVCGEIPETWFENIFRLLPGHNLIIRDDKITITSYYDYPRKTRNTSFEEAKKDFYELFIDAVKIRMRSDVVVGATLSGGIDSTSIVAAVRTFDSLPLESFTASFPGFKDDETIFADQTNSFYSLNGNKIIVDYNSEYLDTLKKIIFHLESGHLSPSIVPLWKIYESASKKVTVVLEGQGADELMGGYIKTFSGTFLINKILQLKLLSASKAFYQLSRNYSVINIFIEYLRQTLPPKARTFVRKYVFKQENVLIGRLKNFKYSYTPKLISNSRFIKILQKSHQTTLVNLLHYGDAISMAFSIESRLPYMDYRLVDLVFSLPDDFLIAEGKGKFIQRESLKKILPNYINTDKRKLGFPSPINDFFSKNKSILEGVLLDEKTINRGLFSEKELIKLINANLHSDKSMYLFRLLCVELWFRKFID